MARAEPRDGSSNPSLRWPSQVKYIIGYEAWERFSFYGMRSILVVYLVQDLLLAQHGAKALFHFFVFASCFATLGGAWLADRFAGRYRTIFWLSAAYIAGYAVIAAFEGREGLYVGLALIAVGSGGVKPCLSALMGDQFRDPDRPYLSKGYSLFYWFEKLGSASSNLLIPILRREYGPRIAFALPGLLMAIALLMLWFGRRRFITPPATGPNPNSFLRVSRHAIRRIGTGRLGEHWLDVTQDRFPAGVVSGTKSVYRILGVFAATFTFWALFDQHSSSWVLQASQMDLQLFGHQLESAQPSALNPFLTLVMIPLFYGVIYPLMARRGAQVAPLSKMTVGMFLTALSFVAATMVQLFIDHGVKLHFAWQLPQYLLLSSGEILVSITGLEFAYTQAPAAMKSTVMSLWFLAVALGNLLTAWVSELDTLHGWAYFAFFAGVMIVGAFAFRVVARRYRPVEAEASGAQP